MTMALLALVEISTVVFTDVEVLAVATGEMTLYGLAAPVPLL